LLIINFVKNQNIKTQSDNLRKWVMRELKELGSDKLRSILWSEGPYKVLKGAYKDVPIPYFTLLYSTLPNFTLSLSNDKEATPGEKKKEYWNPEINECLEILKKANGWIMNWATEKNRRYTKSLISKIKKLDIVKNWTRTRSQYLSWLVAIIANDPYHASKLWSPYEMWDKLASLQQVARNAGKKNAPKKLASVSKIRL
jgi:hypothetical protein